MTIDDVIQKFTAPRERLQNTFSIISSTISKEAQSLGKDLTYKGEDLKVPKEYSDKNSVITAVTTLMQTLISDALEVCHPSIPT